MLRHQALQSGMELRELAVIYQVTAITGFLFRSLCRGFPGERIIQTALCPPQLHSEARILPKNSGELCQIIPYATRLRYTSLFLQ